MSSQNTGHFMSTHEIERFLQHQPPDLCEIVLELRNLVAAITPGATERILWQGLSYHDADRGGPVKAGICQIETHRDHVRLSFIHGAFLDDPAGLLVGERQYKKYVKIASYDHAPWDALADLIRSSAGFDPMSLAHG